MADSNSFFLAWRPRILSILRIVVGFLFILHGAQKLFNTPVGPPGFFPAPLNSMIGIAGIIELVGGIFILLGLFTRPVAFILSGQMAVAYFYGHASKAFIDPLTNQGEAAVLYCFVFLYLAVAGGGAWSLDRALRRRD
jgi:putative oxidoreductase